MRAIVRAAVAADKFAALELMKAFFYAKGFDRADGPTGFSVKPQGAYAGRLFEHHLRDPDCCAIVYDVGGRARGLLLATAFDHPFGEIRVAKESMWWVDPAVRGIGSLKMVDAFEAWARSRGCAGSALSEFADAPIGAIYARKGYRALETTHFKRLV